MSSRRGEAGRDFLSMVEGFTPGTKVFAGGDEPRVLGVTAVTGRVMETLGAEAALGRTIGPGDAGERVG